jgi:predicted metal-binding protein
MTAAAKFTRVGGPPFTTTCTECGRRLQSDREPVLANLHGAAFVGYHCESCATRQDPDCMTQPVNTSSVA